MIEETGKLFDQHGRIHNYLRISLTERCNLRCFYCMPEDGIQLRDKAEFMRQEELLELAKIFVSLGVNKIRLTGGEPLIKKDAKEILLALSKMPVNLAITTNGVLVDRFVETFKQAGIRDVNISLDSLKSSKMNAISRRNFADKIVDNIRLLEKELFNLKVNVVLMKGVNDDEIIDFVEWTKDLNLSVRFIEFMPFDGNNWEWNKKIAYKEIIGQISQHYGDKLVPLTQKPNDTSRNFKIDGFKGDIGVISSVTNPFCDTCNRIRLTADGKIKNCLFSSEEIDLLAALRAGENVRELIVKSINNKHKARGGLVEFDSEKAKKIYSNNRAMTSIGG